jgi:hypothetical protein
MGAWGIGNEGGADRVVINRSKDGLAASVTFRSTKLEITTIIQGRNQSLSNDLITLPVRWQVQISYVYLAIN